MRAVTFGWNGGDEDQKKKRSKKQSIERKASGKKYFTRERKLKSFIVKAKAGRTKSAKRGKIGM
jgi:hypothetical protein